MRSYGRRWPLRLSMTAVALAVTVALATALGILAALSGPQPAEAANEPFNFTLTPDNGALAASWTTPTVSGGDTITGYEVRWTAPADDGSTITDYDVMYRQTSSAAQTGNWWEWQPDQDSDTSTTVTITSVDNGDEYRVRVRAGNGNGDGP